MNNNTKNALLWIVFGALIGWIASAITGVGTPLPINILVGIAGAYLGGYIMDRNTAMSPDIERSFGWRSFLVALLGACILLLVMRVAGF